jgi:hypothetical protein
MRDRYVLLGLARARADWFRTVGQWATSAMLAVLVMAFIGVMMWVAFSGSFDRAAGSVDDRIAEIGG